MLKIYGKLGKNAKKASGPEKNKNQINLLQFSLIFLQP